MYVPVSDVHFLVSTHVVCERLSAMQEQASLPEFLVKNSLSAPAQVFQQYWSSPLSAPPPRPPTKNENWIGFRFELVWSTPPPAKKRKI